MFRESAVYQISSLAVVLEFVPVSLCIFAHENFRNRVGKSIGFIKVVMALYHFHFRAFFYDEEISRRVEYIFILIFRNVEKVDRLFYHSVFRDKEEKSIAVQSIV